jgi:hypothetical protein
MALGDSRVTHPIEEAGDAARSTPQASADRRARRLTLTAAVAAAALIVAVSLYSALSVRWSTIIVPGTDTTELLVRRAVLQMKPGDSIDLLRLRRADGAEVTLGAVGAFFENDSNRPGEPMAEWPV